MADLQDQMAFNNVMEGEIDMTAVYNLDSGYSVTSSGIEDISPGLETSMEFIALNENINYTGQEPYLQSYNDDPSGKSGSRFNTVGPGLRYLYVTNPQGREEIIKVEPNTYYSKDLVASSFAKFVAERYEKNSKSIPNWENLNPNQKAAITSLTYNVGYQTFSMKEIVNEEGYIDSVHTNAYKALENFDIERFKLEAFDPLVGFVKSDSKIISGLQNRRKEELELFNTPHGQGLPPDELMDKDMEDYAELNIKGL